MKKNSIILLLMMFAAVGTAVAQEQQQEEKPLTIVEGSHFSLGARIGYSNLMANASKSGRMDSQTSPGGVCLSFDMAYTHYLNEHIGLRLGVEISDYMSSFAMDNHTITTTRPVDVWTGGQWLSTDASFRTTVNNIKSKYNMFMIGIPAGLSLQGEHWYGVACIKVNLPVSLKEYSRVGKMETVCTAIGNNSVEEIPQTVTERSEAETIIYKSSRKGEPMVPWFIGSVLEAGYRLGNERGHGILLGVYLETSFNAVKFSNSNDIVTFEPDGSHSVAPTLQSNVVKSLQLFDVGVKMQYDISVRRPRRK